MFLVNDMPTVYICLLNVTDVKASGVTHSFSFTSGLVFFLFCFFSQGNKWFTSRSCSINTSSTSGNVSIIVRRIFYRLHNDAQRKVTPGAV